MPDNKPTQYAPLPDFDPETQAVVELPPEDRGDHYFIGKKVVDLDQDDAQEPVDTPDEPFVEPERWRDEPEPSEEQERVAALEDALLSLMMSGGDF